MSDETLKPCPHCECDTPWLESAEHTQGLRWYVFCHACGAMGGWKPTATEAIAAWNTRATHGTLTAEQVRGAIERNFGKVAVIDDGGEKVEWREGWVCNVGFNSQAIADELNAELGSGTCEVTSSYYYDDYDLYEFELSCGHSFTLYDKEPCNYCPICGKQIRKAVEQ